MLCVLFNTEHMQWGRHNDRDCRLNLTTLCVRSIMVVNGVHWIVEKS